jgi:hypothetical protein
VRRERVLIQEDGDVGQDEAGIDDGEGAAGVEVLERDEHARLADGQSTGNSENCKGGGSGSSV